MRITLKQNILFMVAVITLSSILGCILLIQNARMIGKNLSVETVDHIRAMVGQNAEQIEAGMRIMEKNAADLATAGETFFAIVHQTGQDITPEIEGYLVRNFKRFPEAIGGGLWYEPNVLFPDRERFGPYAFRKDGKVSFTWDLNTPDYDYHNQDWYLLAIPKEWDRHLRRQNDIYWTDPYFDQAATTALMITVDALMYDAMSRIIGIATVDFSLEKLQAMVSEMTVTPHSLPFAADISSRLLISFPGNPVKVLQKLDTLEWGGGRSPRGKDKARGNSGQVINPEGGRLFAFLHLYGDGDGPGYPGAPSGTLCRDEPTQPCQHGHLRRRDCFSDSALHGDRFFHGKADLQSHQQIDPCGRKNSRRKADGCQKDPGRTA